MKKNVVVPNLLFFILVITVFLPGVCDVSGRLPFLVVIILIEAYFWIYYLRQRKADVSEKKLKSACDIAAIILAVLLAWELFTTKWGILNKILFPCPENVFMVFVQQRVLMVRGIFSSLELLLIGFAISLTCGVLLGLYVGWVPRLKHTFLPIAKVLSPIPPIIYTPYIIAIMPTFRSASALIIILGIFWPTFMNMVNRVGSVEQHIIDSAKVLEVNNRTMIFHIMLPYVFPGIISGLKVTLSTSFMILIIAEMMGATSGMGYFIKNFSDYGNYTNVVAGIILVGIVITIINDIINLLEVRLIKWHN